MGTEHIPKSLLVTGLIKFGLEIMSPLLTSSPHPHSSLCSHTALIIPLQPQSNPPPSGSFLPLLPPGLPFCSTSLLHFPQMLAPSYSHSSSRLPFSTDSYLCHLQLPFLIAPHSFFSREAPVPSRLYRSHTHAPHLFSSPSFFSKGFICCCKKCRFVLRIKFSVSLESCDTLPDPPNPASSQGG